jgi:hypothetical protein
LIRQIVVARDTPARGDGPTIETHFFQRVHPLLDRLLADGDRERRPLMVLSLDVKANKPPSTGRVTSRRHPPEVEARERVVQAPPIRPRLAGPARDIEDHPEQFPARPAFCF